MFYLYFILPPVVIVISLALVIFLVSRRSFQIEREILESGSKKESDNRIIMEVKSRWLHFLEKIAHWFKIILLKLHNWLEKRLSFIKNRKNTIESNLDKKDFQEKGTEALFGDLLENEKATKSDSVNEKPNVRKSNMDLVKKNKLDKIKRIFIRDEVIKTDRDDLLEEREERVMISDEITYPEEKKEELENILVERIATDPRDIEAYERLGDYYVSQGNTDDAHSCYKQVLKLNPKSLSVRNKLSRFNAGRF